MKNITLIAMENSANHGLGVNFCGYQLSVSDYDSKEDVLQRIRDAAKEYCNTKNGRDTFTRNCNCFITVIFSHLFRKKSCIDMGFIWQQ